MFKNLLKNLTKSQRIVLGVIAQALFIIILILIVQSFTGEKKHLSIDKSDTSDVDLTENVEKFVADNIWEVVKNYVPGAESNDINDAVIREGTYEEIENEDGTIGADFIVDIDSLKQTYVVSTAWSKDKSVVYEVTVSCPPQSEMKYSETICYSAYNNTYSLDLYLPYAIYPDGFDAEDAEPTAPNYMITGSEEDKTLDIMVSQCDADKYKNEAMDYLKTTPIKLDEYEIIYEINSVDVRCE